MTEISNTLSATTTVLTGLLGAVAAVSLLVVRLNIIAHLLSRIPYEALPREKIKFPERQKAKGYRDPDYAYKFVPEKF